LLGFRPDQRVLFLSFALFFVRLAFTCNQDGDDEDWDIQRYLAERDKDARAESDAGDEEGYREQYGDDQDQDGDANGGGGNGGEEDNGPSENDTQKQEANGDDAAGGGAAGKEGKESGLADDQVKAAVDKLEQVRIAT
jgi:hypothetical protein